MASWEIVALDTVTPQLRAPGTGDTYTANRSIFMADALGYYGPTTAYGIEFSVAGGYIAVKAANQEAFRLYGSTTPYGVNVYYRVGLGATLTADVGIERIAAKVLKITDGGPATTSGAGVINLPTFTVAALPTAASAGAGGRASVSDATQTFASANFGATVTGGGANFVPVVSDATNWKIG